MGLLDMLKKKDRTSEETSSETVSVDVVEGSAAPPMPVVDVDAYRALADALVDDAEARAQLEKWFDDPSAYCAGPGEERGLSEPDRQDVLWLALADTLIDGSEQAVELDYEEDAKTLAWALNSIEADPALHLEESDLPDAGCISDCLDSVNALWNDEGWMLAYMDIDSDSYVLLTLTTDRFEAAAPLASTVGKTLIKAHNGL